MNVGFLIGFGLFLAVLALIPVKGNPYGEDKYRDATREVDKYRRQAAALEAKIGRDTAASRALADGDDFDDTPKSLR